MKKILLPLCGIFLTSTLAFAHPPTDIKIEFNKNTHVLNAVIYHPVSNRMTHFIKTVDIGLNGQEIKTLTFTHQSQQLTQPIEIILPEVKEGDVLSVEAYCNLSGKLEKEIKVA